MAIKTIQLQFQRKSLYRHRIHQYCFNAVRQSTISWLFILWRQTSV